MPEAKRAIERDEAQDHAWLGREFLTWLLHRVDREDAFGSGADTFTVGFGGAVRLKAMAGDATDMALKGPSPAHAAGVRAGIGAGHTLREAALRVSRGEREWRFTLLADTLDLKGVKLPALMTEEEDDRFLERISLLEELDSIVKSLFCDFVKERTRPVWQRTLLPELRAWLADGLRVDE